MALAVCQWMCNSSCLHPFALHYRFFLYYNNFHCTILVEQANFNHCCQHSAADGQRQSEIWWHIARVAGNQVGIKFNILMQNFVNFPSMWSSLNQSCLLLEYHMQLQFHKHFFQFIAAAHEAEEQVVHGWVDSLLVKVGTGEGERNQCMACTVHMQEIRAGRQPARLYPCVTKR